MPLSGHLRLICAPDATGQSVLRSQSFAAPVHLSKPHWDGDTLLVNVVNPTAGLFAQDRIEYDIAVEPGAHLLLASPSATRAHTMAQSEACVEQRFAVAAGARLEVWPELFIPQRGSRYRQTTRATVEAGGELLLFEALSPGRTAHGETFAFDRLTWDTDIHHDGKLAVRERYTLRPASPGVTAMRTQFPTAYYASAWLFSPRLTPESACWETLNGLQSATVWIGSSALAHGGWAVKVLAADSVEIRKTLLALRAAIYAAIGATAPDLRRA